MHLKHKGKVVMPINCYLALACDHALLVFFRISTILQEREHVAQMIKASHKELVELTIYEMENFCGNW